MILSLFPVYPFSWGKALQNPGWTPGMFVRAASAWLGRAPALSPSPSAPWGCQERSVAQAHSLCALPTFQFLYWAYKCLKRKTVPSLDPDYGLPLSFGSLTPVLAALVILQSLQLGVWFGLVFPHNFSICSQKKSMKKNCLHFLKAKPLFSLDFWV